MTNYTLTGPELLSVPDQASQLGDVLGRAIATIDVYRGQMLGSGIALLFVDVAVEGAALVGDGGNAVLTGDVHRVLGRPPRNFRAWAGDHRNTFR